MSKLIEKEGRFYKKCVIVMLETEDCTNIHKDKRANSYPKLQKPSFLGGIWKNDPNHYQNVQATRDGLQENFHLSITSDDDIKEGDWYFDFISQTIRQCEDEQRVRLLKVAKHLGNKKIIATTDTLLINECEGCEITGGAVKGKVYNCSCKSLPQPSDKFIQAYIEAYNKGEKIEKVLVEYVIHPNSFELPSL